MKKTNDLSKEIDYTTAYETEAEKKFNLIEIALGATMLALLTAFIFFLM